MAKYDNMTEKELRQLQQQKNEELKALRSQDGKGKEIRALRHEIIAIQEKGDILQQKRYAEYERIASEVEEAHTITVSADAAAAVSEAERILGG